MNKQSMPFWLLMVLVLVAPPVFAQRVKSVVPELEAEGLKGDMARAIQKKANERFTKLDVNKDGFISKEEAQAMSAYADNFQKYDKDEDGKLSWEEFVGNDKWPREAP